jgi:hypothetical protein
MASAWISMSAYFLIMVISYILGQKHYPIPYNLKKIVLYLVSAIVLVLLSFYMFEQNIYIGNALLFVFLTTIYLVEKRNIKQLFKTA